MIILATRIKLIQSGGALYRVTWPAVTVHGVTVAEHYEDYATWRQAVTALDRYGAAWLGSVVELDARTADDPRP